MIWGGLQSGDSSKGNDFEFRCDTATDIGGGHTNQDDAGIWHHRIGKDFVLAVFDGHGRELGKLAAQVAKDSMRRAFSKAETFDAIRKDAPSAMKKLFLDAHEAIKTSFKDRYTRAGWEVIQTPEGYLTKRQNSACPWTCTHGGTTATVVVILDAKRMIVSNVGDSTAIWGGYNEEEQQYKHIELSAEHSPESVEEYIRVGEHLSEQKKRRC